MIPSKDAAWVDINTTFSPEALSSFCADIERLYRINPLLEMIEWKQIDASHFYIKLYNLSNQQTIATNITVEKLHNGFKINYQQGLKVSTWIQIKSSSKHSILSIIDNYNSQLPEIERQQRLAEVDHSLKPWGQAIHEYLHHWQRWAWFPPFRWYMRLWQKMKPMARRITYMLMVITVFEILAFLVLVMVLRTMK